MPFSRDFPRVIYERNPLELVVCQLRYPTILKIESEAPSSFQERIRSIFPVYKEARNLESPLPPDIVRLLGAVGPGRGGRTAHNFQSTDDTWVVGLTRDFVALTCSEYKRWEEFQEKLEIVIGALVEEYKPSYISRIGLRYRDVINRSQLGLSDKGWNELLKPYIAGELIDLNVAPHIHDLAKEVLIKLDATGYVRILHGLNKIEDETTYFIDSDYFTEERTETSNVLPTLSNFNKYARRLFRWCISDELHNAMGPQSI